MYVNGSSEGTSAIPSFTIGRDFWFGNFNDGTTTEGGSAIMDEVAIYTDVLTPAEVTEIYDTTSVTEPAAPINLEVEPFDEGAYLTWIDPRDIGGQILTDYVVEYKTDAAGSWSTFADGTSTDRFATVTGLTNSTLYNFRVSAVNASGTGDASSSVDGTPATVITWDGSTTTSASQTTSTLDIDYATTATFPYTVEIGFELENRDTDAIVESDSTTTLTGIYDITNLDTIDDDINLALASDTSGITYVPTTDTIFTIHNSNGSIDEITREGDLIRTITCTGCGDVEGIEWISSTADALGQYDHTFMTSYEGVGSAIRLTDIDHDDTSYSPGTNYATGLGDLGNLGLEGVAYNSDDDVYYVVREKTPVALYEVDINGAPDVTELCSGQLGGISDLSDVDYSNGELFLLSHESDSITRVTLDPCTVTADTLSLGMTQAEGLTWDDEGRDLYVMSEPDNFSRYRVSEMTFGSDFESTVADGTYDMVAYVTDKDGNRSSSTLRTYTVDTAVGTPTITSALDDPTAETTIGISIDFGLDVSGFDITDLTVGNGTASNFAGGSQIYTADITPTAEGVVTVDIAAAAGTGDSNSLATAEATQFTITYAEESSARSSSSRRRSSSTAQSFSTTPQPVVTQVSAPVATTSTPMSVPEIVAFLRTLGVEVSSEIIDILNGADVGVDTGSEEASESASTCPAFVGFYQEGDSADEVRGIQQFLNTTIGTDLPGTTLFGPLTVAAVKEFQTREADSVLTPWGLTSPSGWWYQSTRKRANKLSGCSEGEVTLDNGVLVE